MSPSLRQLSIGLLLAVFVQPLSALRYLTLPPWMSLISAKNATPVLEGNGTRPVDCIVHALKKNFSPKPQFFFFEPAKSWCSIYAALQGYTMYGRAGRGYFILDQFYTGPSDVCPPVSTLQYGMMNLAYATPNCLRDPVSFASTSDNTVRCAWRGNKRPAVGAYYAGLIGDPNVSPDVKPWTYFSLSKKQVRAGLSVSCGSPVASVIVPYNNSKPLKPYCYAYFAHPKGTDPQAACERKYPGSVAQWNTTSRPKSADYGYWANFGYWAYLPDPGAKTADYVFYEGTGPESVIVDYPFVGCAEYNPTKNTAPPLYVQ